jgi:isoleucyl-tRNA synthetase
VRQPLSTLEVAVEDSGAIGPYLGIIASELNVKFVIAVTPEAFKRANPVERRLTVNARAAGPRIGKSVQQAIAGSKSGEWSEVEGVVTAGGIVLEEGEFELDTVIGGEGDDAAVAAVLPSGGFVALDTTLTPELEAEGYARDLVRAIQDQRKAEGLNVGDRITLVLTVPGDRLEAVEVHLDLIAREVLATSLTVEAGDAQEIALSKA